MSIHSTNEEISLRVRSLFSASETERDSVKGRILQLGALANEQLIELLSDLVENPYPRFANGNQEAGRQAVLDHLRMYPELASFEQFEHWTELADALFINSRLSSDIIYLLGELGAEEAAPILIRIMEGRNMLQGPDGLGPEMVALSKIGAPAIPHLINAIKEAETTARKQKDINLGWVILHDESNEEGKREQLVPTSEELEEEEEEFQIRFAKIQTRAIRVLVAIGEQSLPYLRELIKEARCSPLVPRIEDAIALISSSRNENLPQGTRVEWSIKPIRRHTKR
jgi:hypothetical protein